MEFSTIKATICSDIVSRENRDGSIVLMKTDSSDIFYKITGESSTVWSFIKQGKTPNEALESLCQKHQQVDQEVIRSDIASFLNELEKKNLIVIT